VGTVTASFVVEHPGCQTHLPDWDSMLARFRRHFRVPDTPKERRFA
jgi:hypothetical protein